MNLTKNKYKEYSSHCDLSTDCWDGDELIAICAVDIEKETAMTWHTRSYDSQLDPYYKHLERMCVDKFEFVLATKQELFELRAVVR